MHNPTILPECFPFTSPALYPNWIIDSTSDVVELCCPAIPPAYVPPVTVPVLKMFLIVPMLFPIMPPAHVSSSPGVSTTTSALFLLFFITPSLIATSPPAAFFPRKALEAHPYSYGK